MTSYIFYLKRYAYQFFTCQKTEHRFQTQVRAINRVPVHKTIVYHVYSVYIIKSC